MITILTNKTGKVIRIGFNDKTIPNGAVEVAEIPEPPEVKDYESAELYYKDGVFEYKIESFPVEEVQIEAEFEIKNTQEDLRREEYCLRADKYLMAYNGYMLEGDIESAEKMRVLYLQTKNEIRELYPDNTEEKDAGTTESTEL